MQLLRLSGIFLITGCILARAQEPAAESSPQGNQTALDVLQQKTGAAPDGLARPETEDSAREGAITPREARRLRAQNEKLTAWAAQLEAQLRETMPLARRADRLAAELAEAQSSLNAQAAKNVAMQAETSRLRSELDTLSQASQRDVKVVIKKLEAEAEQSSQAQKELQRQLTLATQARNEDAKTIRLLREEVENAADRAGRAEKLASVAKDVIASKDAEIADLTQNAKTVRRKAIKDQERVLEKADARLTNAAEREKGLALEIQNKNREIEQLQTALAEARKSSDGKTGAADARELTRIRGQLESQGKDLAAATAEAEKRDAELKSLRTQMATLNAEAEALRKAAAGADRAGDSKQQIEALRKDLAEAQKKSAGDPELRTRFAALEKQLAESLAQRDSLSRELAEQARKADAAGTALKQSLTERKELAQQYNAIVADRSKAGAATDSLQQQVKELQAARARLEQKLIEAEASAKAAGAAQDDLTERVTALSKDNASLAKSLARCQAETESEIRKAEEGARTAAHTQEEQFKELGRELADAKALAGKRDAELESLRKQLAALGEEAGALRKTAADASKAQEQSLQIESLGKELADAKALAGKRDAELESLRKQLAALGEEAGALRKTAADASKAQERASAAEARASGLQANLEQLTSAARTGEAELKRLDAEVKSLRADATESTQIAAIKADSLAAQLDEKEKALAAAAQREKKLADAVAAAEKRIGEAEAGTAAQMARVKEENNRLKAAQAQQLKELTNLQAFQAASVRSASNAAARATELESSLKALTQQVQARDAALAQKAGDAQSLTQQLAEAHARIRDFEQLAASAREDKEMQQRLVAEEKQNAAKHIAQIQEFRADAARNDAEIADLKKRLADKTDEIAKMTESLLTARRTLQARAAPAVPETRAAVAAAPARSVDPALRAADAQKAGRLINQKQFTEAEAVYERMLERNPDDADVHYNLAILCDEMLRDKSKASLHYREYLRLRPAASDAARVRAWLAAAQSATRPADR